MPHNILFVDHTQAIGGAENSLLLLMQNLESSTWQPHLATTNGRFAQAAHQANIPTHLLTFPQLRRSASFGRDWWHTAKHLANLAQSVNAQILHANTIRAALYTSLAAKLAKQPFIWHMRDFWLSEGKPQHLRADTLGKQFLISTASRVIANSTATATHLPDSDKIRIVHNGIDISQFDPNLDKRPFCQSFNIPPHAPIVGMVGRLRPWKGQERFLKMAAQIAQQRPDAYFLIVGGTVFGVDDTYPQYLEKRVADLGIHGKTIFTGQTNLIASALATMDIFVHPGDPEPFGLVNIEAMTMQKPVVALAHGALPEIVVNNETGLLISPENETDLSTAVIHLLNNPAQQQKMGAAGRQRVKTHFSIAHTTAQIEAVFSEICP